jgi:hypothetical protein
MNAMRIVNVLGISDHSGSGISTIVANHHIGIVTATPIIAQMIANGPVNPSGDIGPHSPAAMDSWSMNLRSGIELTQNENVENKVKNARNFLRYISRLKVVVYANPAANRTPNGSEARNAILISSCERQTKNEDPVAIRATNKGIVLRFRIRKRSFTFRLETLPLG